MDVSAARRAWGLWPRWTPWVAMTWSAAYAAAGAAWWVGADWYPFGSVPLTRRSGSPLEGLPPQWIGPAFLLAGLAGVGASAVSLRPKAPQTVRQAAIGTGAALAVLATCLIPDYTVLAILALWPVFVVFAFTGVEGAQGGIGDILYWHRTNLVLIFTGGLAWAAATLAAYRRSRAACVNCGRRRGDPADLTVERLTVLYQHGRRLVWLAIACTVPYDVTRFAWFAGWPLGLDAATFATLQDPPELLAVGLGLGILSTIGFALAHGLAAPWGERFPPMIAIVPATFVTASLPPAALMFANPLVNGGFDLANWGLWLPTAFWLLSAVGLGGATWMYHQRRRGSCRHCQRTVG